MLNGDDILQKNKVVKTCEFCQKEYIISKYKADKSKYCCRECKDKHNTQKSLVEINCEHCGKSMVVKKGEIAKGKRFCSNKCSGASRRRRVDKVCMICDKEYETHNRRHEISVTCSKECHIIWQSEIYSKQPEVKERLRQQGVNSTLSQQTEYTKPEMMVLEELEKRKIEFTPQYVIGDVLIADFYLPKYNTVLEVYGDYWHGNPLIYGIGDDKKPLNDMQSNQIKKDRRRYYVLTKNYNMRMYSVWENDIYQNVEQVVDRVLKSLENKIRND